MAFALRSYLRHILGDGALLQGLQAGVGQNGALLFGDWGCGMQQGTVAGLLRGVVDLCAFYYVVEGVVVGLVLLLTVDTETQIVARSLDVTIWLLKYQVSILFDVFN